ncbi:MAG TPA: DUF4476 domain-containing protein [Bacteroidia bacterium]|nr:DUF4476 domain-containing protein [Bacteroidia bacterium]
MKTIIYSSILFLSLAISAKAQTSNLVVFDQQGEKFSVIVNGVNQSSTPSTNVKVTGLSAPAGYKITVIFQDTSIAALNKNIYLQNPGTEVTASVIVKKNGEHALRYVSETPIAQATAAAPVDQSTTAYSTTAVAPVPQSTTTTVTQQTTTVPSGTSTVSVNVGGMGVNMTGMATQATVTTTTTTTSSGTQDVSNTEGEAAPVPQPVYVDGYNGPVGCPRPMSREDFESAKNTIAAKTFEDTKLSIAKQITSSNCLLSSQVRAIMKLFTYENSKLDFAKYAYAHTYDKGNYFKVNDAFQFDSSSEELNNYVATQK